MFYRCASRLMLAVCLCLTPAGVLLAQQPRPAAASDSSSLDDQLVRQAVVAFVDRYNAHNAEGLVTLFAPDARMVLRDGTEVNGHDELKQSFVSAFEANPKGAISVVVDSIRFLTSDVAVEEGSTTAFPDGETLTAKSRYTVVHVKKDGKWLMQAVRVVEEESLSAYGELAVLEWLVGGWIDEGRTERVEANFRWDENKSFLLEEFQVVRDGTVVLKGTQRIGWDPQAKQIRSWTFDSAGGFGEAVWTPMEEGWLVKAKGVTPDGTSASATRMLTRAANDRVIWTATERVAGSEALPDLSVTMVRKPPAPQAE
jgi:uncharacterized protein (TIGR02246 family)